MIRSLICVLHQECSFCGCYATDAIALILEDGEFALSVPLKFKQYSEMSTLP